MDDGGNRDDELSGSLQRKPAAQDHAPGFAPPHKVMDQAEVSNKIHDSRAFAASAATADGKPDSGAPRISFGAVSSNNEALRAIHKELKHKTKSSSLQGQASAATAEEPEMSISSYTTSATTPTKSRKKARRDGQSSGRWTQEEHQAFLRGLQTHGREWKKVAETIPTRTSAQVRSHAQKYFAKVQREENTSRETAVTSLEETTSPTVQANIARILAHPETVQQEVEETLRRLRERYRQLQVRLMHRQSDKTAHDERSDLSSLQNEELIALSVLHESLPHGDTSSNSSCSAVNQENNEGWIEVASSQQRHTRLD